MKQTTMNSSILFRVGILVTLIFPGLGSLAVAQAAKSTAPAAKQEPPRPVDAEPNSTQANFGDWTLRCQRLGNGGETQRVCEVAQQIRAQDQKNAVAEIAIGRLKKADPLRLTVVLPVNITFSNSPSFLTEGNTGEQLDLGWRKCLPGGCIADALLKEDLLVRWKTPTSTGHITWTDAAGRDLTIEPSFRGLSQALDALDKGR
jgi:invasion protein IalB